MAKQPPKNAFLITFIVLSVIIAVGLIVATIYMTTTYSKKTFQTSETFNFDCELNDWSSVQGFSEDNTQGICTYQRTIKTPSSGTGISCSQMQLVRQVPCSTLTDPLTSLDCIYGTPSAWTSCGDQSQCSDDMIANGNCPGEGLFQMRTIPIVRQPLPGGVGCDPQQTIEFRSCTFEDSNPPSNSSTSDSTPCILSGFGPWVIADVTTCITEEQQGEPYYPVQDFRVRDILAHATGNGAPCSLNEIIEYRTSANQPPLCTSTADCTIDTTGQTYSQCTVPCGDGMQWITGVASGNCTNQNGTYSNILSQTCNIQECYTNDLTATLFDNPLIGECSSDITIGPPKSTTLGEAVAECMNMPTCFGLEWNVSSPSDSKLLNTLPNATDCTWTSAQQSAVRNTFHIKGVAATSNSGLPNLIHYGMAPYIGEESLCIPPTWDMFNTVLLNQCKNDAPSIDPTRGQSLYLYTETNDTLQTVILSCPITDAMLHTAGLIPGPTPDPGDCPTSTNCMYQPWIDAPMWSVCPNSAFMNNGVRERYRNIAQQGSFLGTQCEQDELSDPQPCNRTTQMTMINNIGQIVNLNDTDIQVPNQLFGMLLMNSQTNGIYRTLSTETLDNILETNQMGYFLISLGATNGDGNFNLEDITNPPIDPPPPDWFDYFQYINTVPLDPPAPPIQGLLDYYQFQQYVFVIKDGKIDSMIHPTILPTTFAATDPPPTTPPEYNEMNPAWTSDTISYTFGLNQYPFNVLTSLVIPNTGDDAHGNPIAPYVLAYGPISNFVNTGTGYTVTINSGTYDIVPLVDSDFIRNIIPPTDDDNRVPLATFPPSFVVGYGTNSSGDPLSWEIVGINYMNTYNFTDIFSTVTSTLVISQNIIDELLPVIEISYSVNSLLFEIPNPLITDCQVSGWTDVTTCGTYGPPFDHTQVRSVIQQASNGGKPCSDYALTQTIPCNPLPRVQDIDTSGICLYDSFPSNTINACTTLSMENVPYVIIDALPLTTKNYWLEVLSNLNYLNMMEGDIIPASTTPNGVQTGMNATLAQYINSSCMNGVASDIGFGVAPLCMTVDIDCTGPCDTSDCTKNSLIYEMQMYAGVPQGWAVVTECTVPYNIADDTFYSCIAERIPTYPTYDCTTTTNQPPFVYDITNNVWDCPSTCPYILDSCVWNIDTATGGFCSSDCNGSVKTVSRDIQQMGNDCSVAATIYTAACTPDESPGVNIRCPTNEECPIGCDGSPCNSNSNPSNYCSYNSGTDTYSCHCDVEDQSASCDSICVLGPNGQVCSGNGSCIDNICNCHTGYFGFDCATKSDKVYLTTLTAFQNALANTNMRTLTDIGYGNNLMITDPAELDCITNHNNIYCDICIPAINTGNYDFTTPLDIAVPPGNTLIPYTTWPSSDLFIASYNIPPCDPDCVPTPSNPCIPCDPNNNPCGVLGFQSPPCTTTASETTLGFSYYYKDLTCPL